MILWVRGPRKSGKTTLARELAAKLHAVHLDGDDMRDTISTDLGFSDADRTTQNLRVAGLATVIERQGFDVVVSTICPDIEGLVQAVFDITGCRFIDLGPRP